MLRASASIVLRPVWAVAIDVLVAARTFTVEVSAVEAVTQAVPLYPWAVVERASLVPTASAVVPPTVSAAVSDIDARAAEIEVVAARVT